MQFLDFAAREAYDPTMILRTFLAIVTVWVGAGWAHGQSLAELAKTEAARRQTVDAPAKVYTNDDLRPDFSKGTPPPSTAAPADAAAAPAEPGVEPSSAAAAPAAGAPAAGGARGQEYWAGRMADARSKVERSQAFAQALQNRVDMLWTDFVNRGDPVQQRAIEQERNKALAELERLKKEIDENQKAVAAVQDEARRAGVPAGWLR
jgi:hypothetical protein